MTDLIGFRMLSSIKIFQKATTFIETNTWLAWMQIIINTPVKVSCCREVGCVRYIKQISSGDS